MHIRPVRLRACLSLLAPLALTAGLRAQSQLFVNDFRDLPDFNLTDLQPDADALQAGVQTTLRSALEFACFKGGDWIVTLPAGVFALDRVGTEDFGRWGDLDLYGTNGLGDLTLMGVQGQTVIDGSALALLGGPDRVLDLKSNLPAQSQIALDSLVLRGGNVVGRGGGIRLQGGQLTLTDVDIEGCTAHEGGGLMIERPLTMTGGRLVQCAALVPATGIGRGGGAYVEAGSQPTFNAVQVLNNFGDQRGGGAYIAGGASATFTNCQLDGNHVNNTTGGSGGAIAVFGGLSLVNCVLVGNDAQLGTGGAVSVSGINAGCSIQGTTFIQNKAGSGGALATANSAGGWVSECTFFNNTAANLGGGWSHASPALAVLELSTLFSNSAQRGGGLYVFGTLHCDNSTISSNSADEGGGLYFGSGAGSHLRDTTIAFNTAALGAGVRIDASLGNPQVELRNSLLADNLLPGGQSQNFVGAPQFTQAISNLDSDGSTQISPFANVIAAGGNVLNAMLQPLANNGGPTMTHALQACSPAVASGACLSPTDQRGVPRLSPCDIGAYETNGAPCWVTTYCTAKPTTIPGCSAGMLGVGLPLFATPVNFTVFAQPTPGANPGIFFWSKAGPAATPFAGGFLCVQSPLTRSAGIAPSGNSGVCNGGYKINGQGFGSDWQQGTTLWVQCWFRDPGNILDSSFSSALSVTVL